MNAGPGWQFHLFGFPVRVHVSFWIVSALLGLSILNPLFTIMWVAVVFVSVLIHEMGHAVASQSLDMEPQIMLYAMGGLTISQRPRILSYPQEIMISLAGPIAGFLTGLMVYFLGKLLPLGASTWLFNLYFQLLWVNIGWGIINLIPMLPLDGGNVMQSLVHWIKSPYDNRTPLVFSVAVGIIAMIASLILLRSLYIALLAAWFTYNNYMALQGRGFNNL